MKLCTHYTFLFLFLLFCGFSGFAQDSFEVDADAQVDPNSSTSPYVKDDKGGEFEIKNIFLNQDTRTLDIELNAVQNNRPISLDATNISIEEIKDGVYKDFTDYISDIKPIDEVQTEVTDQVSILFLIDLSGSMRGEKVETAKKAIRSTINNTKLPGRATVYLAGFHDDILPSENNSLEINTSNLESRLSNFVKIDPFPYGKETDLYRALIVKLDEFNKKPGKKAIILLSDGENSIRNQSNGRWNFNYDPANPNKLEPFTPEDVYNKIATTDSSTLLFPVGLGDQVDVNFLKKLPELTQDTLDQASFTNTPEGLDAIFSSVVSEFAANYRIKVQPPKDRAIFNGSVRKLSVIWRDKGLEASKNYQYGTQNSPVDLRSTPPKPLIFWVTLLLGGLIGVFGLLAVLVLLVPWYRKKNFREKYVKAYKKAGNITKSDPITLEPFEDGDLIVDCCKVMMAMDTWEHNGNQCVNYPGCLNDPTPCQGKGGNTGHEKFFSQKGLYRNLNWFWFGALGGLIAWMFYAVFQNVSVDWFTRGLQSLISVPAIEGYLTSQNVFESMSKNMETLGRQVLDGIGLGMGLCFSLALVEEMGQARKISVLRIFFRTLLGVIMALVVFTIGFLLQYTVLPNAYFAGLISWVLFGLFMGVILSIRSTINLGKGLLGGLFAGLVAFQLYYFVTTLDHDYWPFAKLMSFILLGGILGVIIVAVVSSYEDFELEYVEPAKYRRVNPISKWLKAGMDIFIGTDQSCYVYINWEDPAVQPQHALLSYDKKKNLVYIEPKYETLINNKVIPADKKTELQDGDLIQPGKLSLTRMRFKVKKPAGKRPARPSNDSGATNLFKKKPQKGKIKIKKRED